MDNVCECIGQCMVDNLPDGVSCYYEREKPPVAIWICPACEGENPCDGKAVWSGKNLMCRACQKHHYYSEYTVKQERIDDLGKKLDQAIDLLDCQARAHLLASWAK